MSKKEKEVLLPYNIPGASKDEKVKNLWQGVTDAQGQTIIPGWYGCKRCDLCNFRQSDDIVFAEGNANADILIIGEAPGEEEDRTGRPFCGPSGKLLNQILCMLSADQGMQDLWKWWSKIPHTSTNSDEFHKKVFEWREKEFFITNVVACRPPENATPARPHIQACWERVLNIIYTVDPLLIITSGATAAAAIAQRTFEITKFRGHLHDIQIPGRTGKPVTYPMMPTLHPSFLLRKADYKDDKGDYRKTVKDFYSALRIVDHLKQQYYGTPIPERLEP